MDMRPPLDPDTLVVLAASRPAHEIFQAIAIHLAQSDPQMRLKTFSISKTPLLTLEFVLPDVSGGMISRSVLPDGLPDGATKG